MAKYVYIYEFDSMPETTWARQTGALLTAQAELKREIAAAGKLEIVKRVFQEDIYTQPSAVPMSTSGTGGVSFIAPRDVTSVRRTEDVVAFTFPAGTDLEQVSERVYGSGVGVELIKTANALRYSKKFGHPAGGLRGGQTLTCPEYVATLNDTPATVDSNTDNDPDRDELALRLSVRPTGRPPEFIRTERAELEKHKDGLAVVIFRRGADPSADPECIKNLISVSVRDSLFEGMRVARIKMPYGPGTAISSDEGVHLYGNHIAIAIDGVPVFYGMLITPKVDSKKGTTIQWTAMSHSYTLIKSHFNPQIFKSEWANMRPIDMLTQIANAHEHPISVPAKEYELLKLKYEDEDGQTNMASDIMGTTPFKLLQKMTSSIGRFLHPTTEGFLEVRSVMTTDSPVFYITDGEGESETVPTVLGTFSVQYNFDELAGTYTVMEQKRDATGAQMLQIEGFPVNNMFKNLVRDEAAPMVLDRTTKLATSLTEGDPALSQATGAAVFEASKAFANAVKIDIEVPGWKDPKGNPWSTGTTVDVNSPVNGLGYHRCVITSVDFKATGKKKVTKLAVSLFGQFDSILPVRVPFLLRRGDPITYTARSYAELIDDVEAGQ